ERELALQRLRKIDDEFVAVVADPVRRGPRGLETAVSARREGNGALEHAARGQLERPFGDLGIELESRVPVGRDLDADGLGARPAQGKRKRRPGLNQEL